MSHNIEQLQRHEIPNRVRFVPGNGGLTKTVVTTNTSAAEIYLHGAHVTGFQKNAEPPLLFMSAKSSFTAEKAIRGGVPICFPWFGSRAGVPAHHAPCGIRGSPARSAQRGARPFIKAGCKPSPVAGAA